MKRKAWRVCLREHQDSAFSGIGSSNIGGRWNSPGRFIVYCSDSLALASREYLSNFPLDGQIIPLLAYFELELEESQIESIALKSLPTDWNVIPAPVENKKMGDAWYDQQRSFALAVPSALVPVGTNYLLNTRHPDYKFLHPSGLRSFAFDERTEKIIKMAIRHFQYNIKKKKMQ